MSADLIHVHPDARQALHNTFVAANLRLIVVQTLGFATQSAGTHGPEGTYTDADGNEQQYTSCIDLSVNQPATRLSDGAQITMDEEHINWFLEKASENNLGGFHRVPSEGFTSSHIHLVCMQIETTNPVVQHQAVDLCTGHNGLKGHAAETYFTASDANDAQMAQAFIDANPNALPAYLAALKAVAG